MAAKNEQPQELDLPVAFYDPKDRPLSSLIKGGFKRGATEAGSAITDLLPSMYYEGTGQHEEALKQLEERKAKLQQAELENPKAFKSYHEVDGFEDAIKYLGENLGEQSALLPYSIGPGIAGRIGAGMLGRRAATKGVEELLAKRAAEQGIKGEEAKHLVANMLEDRAPQALIDRATKNAKEKGLAAGLFAGSGALNIPETYEQIYSETNELHPGLATVFGSGKAALDMMFDQHLLRQLSPAQKDLLVAEAAKKSSTLPDTWKWAFAKEAAKNAALEGGTETAQSMIDTVAQQAAGSKHPFFSPEHVDEWVESGLVGWLTGSAFGAPGAALEAGRNVAEQRQAHEAFLAEQEQKAADEQYRQALTQQQGLPPQVPPTVQPGIQPTPPTVTGVDSEQPTTPPSPTALGAGPGQTQPSVTPTQEDMFAQPPVTGLEAQEDAFPQELKAAQAAPLQPSAEDMFTGPPIKEVQPIKVLDAKTLKSTGLKPISPIYKRLLDVDLSTPEGMELFKSEADRVQKNAKISDATKEKIAGLYGQAFDAFAQQQEMFGPRGGVLKGAAQRVQPRIPGTRGRASVGVPVESRGVSGVPEGAGESDIGGLGSAPPIPPTSGVGEGVSEPALTPPEPTTAPPTTVPSPSTGEPVIPITPYEEQDHGEVGNALKERARAAYAAGDIDPGHYMNLVNLIAKGEHPMASAILDHIEGVITPSNQAEVTEEGRKKSTARGKADLDRLISMLGAQMYDANLADVSIKEMVQNSFDAVKASLASGQVTEGKIDVAVDPFNRLIYVRDNGQGMTPKIIQDAFLTVAGSSKEGLEEGAASGGFGMAKAAFMLGNERIWVKTTKNGTESTFAANGSEIFSKDIDLYEDKVGKDKHGTTIVVKVPENVKVNGEDRYIWFPHSADMVDFFKHPMLNPNIEINFGVVDLPTDIDPASLLDEHSSDVQKINGEIRPVGLAKHFDMSGYYKHTTANFDWGKADLYISKQPVRDKYARPKHSVLSSGIYQFNGNFTKSDGWDLLPYNIIIDVKPSVPAESPTYPFNLKREGWKSQITADVGALAKYLNNVVAGKAAAETVDTFKSIESLPKVDVEKSSASEHADVEPYIVRTPKAPKSAKTEEEAKEKATFAPTTIDVSDGEITGKDSEGKTVTYVSKEDEKYKGSFKADKEAPKAKDFLLDMGVDDTLPIFHNNTNVDYIKDYPGAKAFFSEIGSLILDFKNKVAELHGRSWKYADLVGDTPYFTGISIDKDYHGVNIVVPFKGAMLNPLAVKGTTIPSISMGLYDTMVHEFAHVPERNHNADFVSAFHDLNASLAADGYDLEVRATLGRLLKKHKELFNKLREAYEDSTTHNLAKSLSESEKSSRVPSGRDVDGTARGAAADTINTRPAFSKRGESEVGRGVPSDVGGREPSAGRGTVISVSPTTTIVPNLPENFEGIKGPFNTVKALDRAITKFPFTGPKQQGVLSQAMTGLGNTGKKFMLDVLPGHALSDAAETQGIFPKGVASSYHRAMQQHDGYMHQLNEKVNEVNAHKFRNAMKVARKQQPTFNRLTNMSTLIQYDPSKANAMQELKQFSMGYIEFNPDGTQKREVIKYFNTIQERNKAIAAHNKNHTEEERAFVHRDAADAETIKDAEKVQAMWDSPLNGAWKDLYKSLRNANSEILKTYKSSIGSRIDSLTELDEGQRVIQKKSILTKLAEHGMIEPYFTLGREGDHWLSADIPNPDGVYTEQFTTAFKNPMERAQLETKLKNYVYKIERERNIRSGMSPKEAHDAAMQTAMYRVRVYANVDEINYKNLPSTSVINDILASVKRQSPPQGPNESNAQFNDRTEKFNQITDDILRTVIHALPETSFLKNLQKRKGTAGYNEDVMSTFERKSRNSIRQIANLRFKPNLDAVLKQMKDYTELLGRGDETTVPRDNSEQKLYTEAFTKHANMALKPSISELGRFLKGGVFTGTLGFNISSGLIELSNIPMIAFPYLGAEYGMSNTISALGRAHRLVRGSGKVRKVSPYGAEITGDVESELLKSGKSITNYDPTKGIGARYATAIQIWKDAGQLNRSQLYELLMGSSRTTQLDRLNAMSGWMMHEMGRYNREVSLIAAYELEMARLKKVNLRNKTNPMSEEDMKKSAANTALHNTEMVNGSIAAASAPTLAQNDVGSLIYMYKRFGISQYYTLIRTAMDAFKYEKDPQMRGALRRRLGYMIGTVGIMSGVRGLPIFGLLAALWGMLKDDDDPDLDMLARSSFGDMLANGIPETVLGISLSDRTGLSNMIFREPKGDTASFSQWLVESVGGPLPGLADRWLRGYQLFSSGQTERGIEMMMPVALTNVMKSVRYATTGRAETLRGDPVVGDITLKDSAAQLFGFTPEPISKAMEFASKTKDISEAITKKETNAKRKYYMAAREDDQEGMDRARQELLDLGAKHPELEIDEGTVDGILAKSLKAQQQHTDRMFGGKEYPKKHMDRIRQLAEDWDYSTGPEGELVEE